MANENCTTSSSAARSSPQIRRSLAADAPAPSQPAQPTPPAPVNDTMDGALVKRAEKLLKQVGFNPGRVDRVFSANTQEAVRSFQQAVGLDPTGNLDVRTMNAL